MRCPDCNKFVSYDEAQVEIDSGDDAQIDVTEQDGKVTAEIGAQVSVRLVLPCGECGTELKEATFDIDLEATHACAGLTTEVAEALDFEFSVEGNDRMETKDRHGKPIKNPRYMTHYYGVEVKMEATCPNCGERIEVVGADEMAASGMDELV